MALNYGTDAIPGDTYSVVEGGTVQVAAAFTRTVGLIGGMDTANGTATEGEVTTVTSVTDAGDKFGTDSELYYQSDLAFANGATEVYAVPVPETSTTESFSSTSSGQLSNTPFFNPEIHNEHDVTAQDTSAGSSVDVEIVYVDGSPSPPSSGIALDYITGQWTAASSSSYDITYTYGDYSASVIQEVLKKEPRKVAILTESESTISDLDTELQSDADNFQFAGGVGGAAPFEDPSSPDTAGYSDGLDTERISVVSSPYWYVDDAETNLQRVHGGVAGELASLPLGLSATSNTVNGVVSPRTNLSPSQASDLIDEQVLPLINYPPAEIVKDLTTSTEGKFERVYVMDIIDEVLTLSHQINRDFTGEQTVDISQLERSHKNMLKSLTREDPPLLYSRDGQAYYASAVQNASDDNQVDLDLAIDPVGVIDVINVSLTVGDIVEAEVT